MFFLSPPHCCCTGVFIGNQGNDSTLSNTVMPLVTYVIPVTFLSQGLSWVITA